jgi:hypothetical protein
VAVHNEQFFIFGIRCRRRLGSVIVSAVSLGKSYGADCSAAILMINSLIFPKISDVRRLVYGLAWVIRVHWRAIRATSGYAGSFDAPGALSRFHETSCGVAENLLAVFPVFDALKDRSGIRAWVIR